MRCWACFSNSVRSIPGELRPPRRGIRFEKLDVENQHEPRQRILVFAQAGAQQRQDAGGLADGAGPEGFVLDGLPDLLFQEVEYVEEQGCEFGVAAGCHVGWLRSVSMPDM